jgi:hypothetical protein
MWNKFTRFSDRNMGFVLITPRSDGFRQVQQIYNSLGAEMTNILPVAHSLTGCDTTSYCFGIGKKTVYKIRKQNTKLCRQCGINLQDSVIETSEGKG